MVFEGYSGIPGKLKNQLKLYIKNMSGPLSKRAVMAALQKLGLHSLSVETGEVEIEEELSIKKVTVLKENLLLTGYELLTNKEHILIEKVKSLVIEMVHYSDELPKTNYSSYISKRLRVNYTYLSKLFSRVKNITIEHYIIAHKIERVKQMLLVEGLTLSEIAWKLQYSSTAHLSAQFKKVTGYTPSLFKKSFIKLLTPIENI
jgi:AraC-like DNA-binding protein